MQFKLFGRVWGRPSGGSESFSSEGFSELERNAISTVSRPSNWLLSALGGGPTASGISIGPQIALQISTVYACIRNLTEDVAKLKIGVYKRQSNGGRVQLKDHPLAVLLRRPNVYQDRFQFVEQVMFSLLLRGNAYIVLLRNRRGGLTQMVCVQPDKVTILEAQDGDLFYQIQRSGPFENKLLDGTGFSVPAEDVIHIRLMSSNGLTGMSPIAYARETLGISIAAEKYQAKLLNQSARPGGVLKHPTKLSVESAQRLKAQWDDMTSGLDNAGKTAVLEEGMDWKPLGMTSVDAEFMATRRFTVEEICRIFRMPPHMVQDLTRSTNNNIAQQGTDYLTHTLSPFLERIEAAFDRSFEFKDDEFMEFSTEGLTRGDAKTQAETDKLAREGGWLTANECRVKRGLNPKPGGDVLERPVNKVPADQKPEGGKLDKPSDDNDADDKPSDDEEEGKDA